MSPDGQTLAVERRRINAAERFESAPMNADGSDQRILTKDYMQMYGIGPVWSPDGSSIVFQRSCQTYTGASGDVQPCYPQHEAVVVAAGDNDPRGPAGIQAVIATVRTGEGVGLAAVVPDDCHVVTRRHDTRDIAMAEPVRPAG